MYAFTYQQTLLHTILLLGFKIVESLQCIFKETGVKNIDQKFHGLIICCYLKISENLKYLIQQKLGPSKKVTQNLENLENITHF